MRRKIIITIIFLIIFAAIIGGYLFLPYFKGVAQKDHTASLMASSIQKK